MTARNAASINLADYDWCEVFMFACTGRCDSNGCDGVLDEARAAVNDPVSHPAHYTAHPSGVECIQVTEHMGFCLGNAVKYIWRADLKDDAVEDLKKAAWYIEREIARRTEGTRESP